MTDIRAIRVLCPVCDSSLSVLIDGGDERNLRIPDGAIASEVRRHIDAAHHSERPTGVPFASTGSPKAALYNAAAEQLNWSPQQVDVVPDHVTYALVSLVDQVRRIISGEVARGEKAINEQRTDLGVASPSDVPEVGETVHYLWAEGGGPLHCFPARVGGIQTDGTRLNLDLLDRASGVAFADAVEEDPAARTASTWHWPCDKAGAPMEPDPDTQPVMVTLHVHGGALNERDLRDAVQREIQDALRRAWGGGNHLRYRR
jgi:hypothetical protein